jgi:curved DNA-binding protein CbpA
MANMKNYYQILQVDSQAEEEVIVAAYKRLALKYHPDTNKSPDAKRRMQAINEAYNALSNLVERERYDRMLQARITTQESRGTRTWGQVNQQPQKSNGNGDASIKSKSSPVDAKHITRDDKLLGFSGIVVYTIVLTILLIILGSRVQNILVIILILILAGVISVPIIFRVDDKLNRKR